MKLKWHKLKIWKAHVVRRMLAAPLLATTILMSVIAYPTHAFNYAVATEPVASGEIIVLTNEQYGFPVESLIGVSQGYHILHSGVDLRAPKGTEVRSMSTGVVVEVKKMVVGYGHFVRIAHEGTLSSLYAHLDRVDVVAGERVKKEQKIGTVGLTGWTTGPHLHFEVYEGNRAVNPTKFIAQ